MRAFRVSVAVAFVLLFAFSNARIAFSQTQTQTPWIDQTKTTDYVTNLLSWYNLDAKNSPNFLLYHGVGYNFRVFVLKATPNNSTLTVFAFFPIQANDPQVEIISNSSFYDLTGLTMRNNITLEGSENGGTHFIIGNTTFTLTLIFATLTSNVLTNTLANSEAFGKYLYRLDAANTIPPSFGWMNQSQADEFGQSVVADYNALVDLRIQYNSNFTSLKPFLSLYHSPYDNFKIVVTRWASNDSQHITLYFFPISGNRTEVVVDQAGTTDDYAGSAFFGVAKDVTFMNGTTITQIPLIYGTNASVITGNPYAGAETVAKDLLSSDQQMWAQANPPPPWYWTLGAQVIYALLTISGIAYLYEFVKGNVWPRSRRRYVRHPRKPR